MRECFHCGKEFIPGVKHLYKKREKGKVKIFCSWNCMRAFEKEKEKKDDQA